MNAVSERATRKTKVQASVPYEPWLKRRLTADPEQAILYLQAAMEETSKANDPGIFQVAMKDVVEAHGSITAFARKTGLNRQHLYRIMSPTGNPSFSSLWRMLRALGVSFIVIPRTRHLRNART